MGYETWISCIRIVCSHGHPVSNVVGEKSILIISIYSYIKKITERKAQIARAAFFIVPLTGMAAGWMVGVELGKVAFGRKDEKAWALGSLVPGGIYGIWRRDLYMGMRNSLLLAAVGVAYQYSCNNNLTNSFLFSNYDNPNLPTPHNKIDKDSTFFNLTTRGEYSKIHENLGIYFPDPGPSWKKWEDEKKSE